MCKAERDLHQRGLSTEVFMGKMVFLLYQKDYLPHGTFSRTFLPVRPVMSSDSLAKFTSLVLLCLLKWMAGIFYITEVVFVA